MLAGQDARLVIIQEPAFGERNASLQRYSTLRTHLDPVLEEALNTTKETRATRNISMQPENFRAATVSASPAPDQTHVRRARGQR